MKSSLLRTDEELSQLYDRHVNTVYRVCFMYMKNRHDTEDMVQNTFIRLLKDQTAFENTEHEKAWLIRTATNLCKDFFKRWWTRKVSLKNEAIEVVEVPFKIDETLSKVMALPSKYKTAIYMYYYEGYTTVDIAKILNKKESTIRSHLYTARQRLKIEIKRDEV